MQVRPKIVAIVGPNASGKSDLAVKIARRFNGEIISADSRQVYKGMDIGTGKVTKKEMGGVRHYLLDIASPKRTFTVAQYQKFGRKAVAKILAKGKLPVVCGGTGLYVDALLYNYQLPSPPPDAKLRAKLGKLAAEALFLKLKKLDSRRARNIDRWNRRRLVRALEIILKTGRPVPKLEKSSSYDALFIGISHPKEILKKRIRARLLARLKQGMAAEIKKLRASGVSWRRLENFGLEYRWLARYFQKKIGKDEMIEGLAADIGRYAKRQMTWFKRNPRIRWVKNPEEALKIVRGFLTAANLTKSPSGIKS